jgi:hypothetical protein
VNSKWIKIKDLNLRFETVKLLQERTENMLERIGISNNFLNRIPIDQQLRERISKWGCIKLKGFCTTKETVTRLKKVYRMGEKSLPAMCLARV